MTMTTDAIRLLASTGWASTLWRWSLDSTKSGNRDGAHVDLRSIHRYTLLWFIATFV